MGDGSRIERITMVSLLQRGMSMSGTTEDQRKCHLRGVPHDLARQGISTSNLDLSTSLTPILQLSPIASYRLKYSKEL